MAGDPRGYRCGCPRPRPAMTAAARRSGRPRTSRGVSTKPAKAGNTHDSELFERNSNVCQYPGCGKKYRRKEHKVRHEKM
jgi:hypothetical protein